MIKCSKNFQKVAKEFSALKFEISQIGITKNSQNGRFGNQFATLDSFQSQVKPILISKQWDVTSNMDVAPVYDDEKKLVTMEVVVVVRLTKFMSFGRSAFIEEKRSYPVSIFDNRPPHPNKLEGVYTYNRRTILASLLDVLTTAESMDQDGSNILTSFDKISTDTDVFSFAAAVKKALAEASSEDDVDYIAAVVEERKATESEGKTPILLDKLTKVVESARERFSSSSDSSIGDSVGGRSSAKAGAAANVKNVNSAQSRIESCESFGELDEIRALLLVMRQDGSLTESELCFLTNCVAQKIKALMNFDSMLNL